MNREGSSLIHSLHFEQQYKALEIFINSKLIDIKSVNHNDIIVIGEKLKELYTISNNSNLHEKNSNDYLDNEINQMQVKLEKEHILKMECLMEKMNMEKLNELNDAKKKYEDLIDRISEIHIQSERTKLNAQKRKFEQELKNKLEEQASEIEKRNIEKMEKERAQYYQQFCEKFDAKIRDTVRANQIDQEEYFLINRLIQRFFPINQLKLRWLFQKKFEKEKQKIINDLETKRITNEEKITKGLKAKLLNIEQLIKSRYRQLYMDHQNLHQYCKIMKQNYENLQSEFKRFIDATDGYYRSDYLLKMKAHVINICEKKQKIYQSILTEELFTPDDFDRCKYID